MAAAVLAALLAAAVLPAAGHEGNVPGPQPMADGGQPADSRGDPGSPGWKRRGG